jgi:hypothetical protein
MNTEQSYNEAAGNPPFDWKAAIECAETDDQWKNLAIMAKSWTTCACGNQCDVIPRFPDGEPVDEELSIYGVSFMRAIKIKNKRISLRILETIEIRSNYLITQINKQKNV